MAINLLTKFRRNSKSETTNEHGISKKNHQEKRLELVRKHLIQTIGEANEVRYFYRFHKENEQHISFVMLEKAISKAILSDRENLNELKDNEIHLSNMIDQVNIYLIRRCLHTKIQEGSKLITEFSHDHVASDPFLVQVKHSLKTAMDCHAYYLSTASEIRIAFDQLNQAIQVVERKFQLI